MRPKQLALAAVMLLAPLLVQASNKVNVQGTVEHAIRHQLVMLPYLNIFDDLTFRVDGGTVTLYGEVTQPYLKSDAENVVKQVEGVTRVSNQIEVLPLSPFDDQIRVRTYRALFGYARLERYAMGTNPSIRIIVKNGNVTLKGAVSSEMDRNLAFQRASGVSQVFSVKNELRVDN